MCHTSTASLLMRGASQPQPWPPTVESRIDRTTLKSLPHTGTHAFYDVRDLRAAFRRAKGLWNRVWLR